MYKYVYFPSELKKLFKKVLVNRKTHYNFPRAL